MKTSHEPRRDVTRVEEGRQFGARIRAYVDDIGASTPHIYARGFGGINAADIARIAIVNRGYGYCWDSLIHR
jgi:hypothetical protein